MTVMLDTETKPDFGGWATKADIKCADGVTIAHDAFKDMDGLQVPLVFQHGHEDPEDVLGHAKLENRGEGVYARCYFNDNPKSKIVKTAVMHGDLTMLSIYANEIRKRGDLVVHGIIREVSIVQAGANPGAAIDSMIVRHADGYGGYEYETLADEVIIKTGIPLQHSALPVEGGAVEEQVDENDPDAVWDSMTPAQQQLASAMVAVSKGSDDPEEEDPDETEENGKPDENVDPENPETGEEETAETETEAETVEGDPAGGESTDGAPAPDAATTAGDPATHSALSNDDPKGPSMTTKTAETISHNVFDQEAAIKHGLTGLAKDNKYVLSHADKKSLFSDALTSRSTSLRDVVDNFKIQHGVENIEILFPDAKAVSDTPDWVKRRTEWVDRVINGAKHTPFSRIKSLSADLTLEQARAKGYIKGALKKEEFFAVAKRVTEPQTIYKKQKLDRDDILDITDFDIVVWLKGEMRLMLDEELARAVLVGDGRSNADDDKILEDKIRPIATDHELFQTTVYVEISADDDPEKIVDEIIMNRRFYKGSGNPDFFTTEEYLSRMLNIKDATRRRIYANVSELASVLRVNSIIPVEVMEEYPTMIGIMVNMVDYTIGTNRGGQVSLFDDFDIDYNQYKYLIEVRCSGALTKPKSAIVVRRVQDDSVFVTAEAPTWDADDHSVTVKQTTGITYKNRANGAILSHNSPVVLQPDQELTVIAVPSNSGYYIRTSEDDEFTFSYSDGFVKGPF